jgi:Clp amino terminal domain, pathogenicity island component
MFERFTVAARDVVTGAVEVAGEVRAPQTDTGHLLVALARDTGPTGDALRAAGATAERLLPDLAVPGAPAGFDPAALSALGIDYDEVRRAVDDEFGAGALDRALTQGGSRSRRRHVPFAPEGKKALERSLREALALRDRHIGAEHVLLGVLADPAFLAVRLLARYETDVPALRRSVLDGRGRRAG